MKNESFSMVTSSYSRLLFSFYTFVSFSLFFENEWLTLSILKYKNVVHILIFLYNINI